MSELAYLNFDLLIERAEPDYRVRVLASPAGETRPVSFRVPFSDLEVENFLLRIGRPQRRVRAINAPQATAIKDFGGRLFEALFPPELRVNLASSLSRADAMDAGLRIRLRLSDCPELSELPWEYLYDREHDRFLCLSDRTPLVRYFEVPDPVRVLPVTPPLRILVVIASPSDLPQLDSEQEWRNVTAALSQLTQRGRVEVVRLAQPTLGALQRQLRHDTYHIFHFIGHGGFDPNTQDGMLAMEDDHGRARLMAGEDLGTLLHNHRSLRLAVLNFSGTTLSLVQQGIPAVVAMQFEITDDAAITFGHVLYEAIADGYPLDAATAEARIAVYAEGNLTEWGTPVLYLGVPDGRIFDIQDRPPTLLPAEEARREAPAQGPREAEQKARLEAAEQARREAPAQGPREAEQQARLEAAEQARREAALQALWWEAEQRWEAGEQAQREAEEQARQAAAEMRKRAARLLADRYELGELLGLGGMTEVRRGVDQRLGRSVAVKQLRTDLATDPTFQARFRREAESAAGLNHPTIVAVYDTGEEIDPLTGVSVPYIVMELVEGPTLRDVLREGRKILPERAMELTQGILDALSYSHKAGIVHRDIKPANVMLTPNGGVKVMDFGIARAVADTSATMTQTAAVIGTAQYLSPEQARGETVDARSDLYSAGCVLYELLLGRPPFIGDSPVSVAYQHVREAPVPPSQLDPEITPEIDAVVLKALAKDPADRYQSAREMKADLTRLLAGQQTTAQQTTAVVPMAAGAMAANAYDTPTNVAGPATVVPPEELAEEEYEEEEPRARQKSGARREIEKWARRTRRKLASAGPDVLSPVVDENVQFTVYRPNAVQPEVWYPLLAFAHLAERRPDAPPGQPDPLEQVQRLATQVLGDEAAYNAPRVDARGGVPREGQLTFVPLVEGVDFNPRTLTFEWQEDVHQQNFRLKARPATAGSVVRGRLTVYLGAFILADVDLTFRVDFAAPPPPTPTVRPVTPLATSSAPPMSLEPELTPVTAVPYQKVFPSYSHKDLTIVHQAEAYGKALGHVYLRDRLALRSGEDWEQRLLELIDEADIFQLFWSSNSMRSEYVRREWEHALALGRREFIRPTYWEVPMPHSANPLLPPDELAKLHFHGFFEESDGTSGSPRSKRGSRRRVARILTAAAAVATILAVPALTLWPASAPTGTTSPASPAATKTSSASPAATKTPVPPLPRSTPLTDTQLLVPVLVDGSYDIYLGDVTKNAPVRALIKRPGDDAGVTLSPDRASMIYENEGVLQVAAADGTGSRPLFSRVPKQCAKSNTRPGWNSADPTQIAIACVDADGKAGVYLMTVDGKVIRKLSEGDDRVGDPGFSPDGKFVVFWANAGVLGDRGFDGGDIVVASTDGKGKPRRVTRMTNTVFDADPAWSPKGDQLAFRRRDRTGDLKNSDVYVIDADGKSEAKPLADDPHADEQNPAWSPSGDQIAYQSNAKTPAWPGPTLDRVWMMNSNGNNQQVLWTSGRAALGAQIGPSWSSR